MIRTCLLLTTLIFSACATPGTAPQSQPADSGKSDAALLGGSRIELIYVLGHVHRRLELQARDGKVLGHQFYERQLLQEGQIPSAGYESFWKKVSDYTKKHPAKDPDLGTSCANTYRITLETPKGIRKIEGCRTHTTNDSVLSHLIREGEFLMTRRSPSSIPGSTGTTGPAGASGATTK